MKGKCKVILLVHDLGQRGGGQERTQKGTQKGGPKYPSWSTYYGPIMDTKMGHGMGSFLVGDLVSAHLVHTLKGYREIPVSVGHDYPGYRVVPPEWTPFGEGMSSTERVGGGLKGLSPYISVLRVFTTC